MIHFPRKRCLFISTTSAIRTRDQGDEKFGSLKDFEVHDILEKEPRSKWTKYINLISMVICPNIKK
jgi:hypothetical protein